MKKVIGFIATFAILLSFVCLPSHAAYTSSGPADVIDLANLTEDVTVSEPMTLEEALAYLDHDLSKTFYHPQSRSILQNNTSALKSKSYRVFTVTLDVDRNYKPHLEFLCETSEGGHFFNIDNIYSVQLDRRHLNTNMSKQFSGSITVWLRGVHTIEYYINGDFYEYGETTVTGGSNLNIGVQEFAQIGFSVSVAGTNNHYKYFTDHKFITYGN